MCTKYVYAYTCTCNIPIFQTEKLNAKAIVRQRTEGRTKPANNLFAVHIVVTVYKVGKVPRINVNII